MMKSVGITGGIGSGKTRVSRIFGWLGYAVYNADARAKALMVSNPEVVSEVKENFGEDIYSSDGNLNRALLASRVFGDEARLQILNGIVHPRTREDFQSWMGDIPKDYAKPFVLKEAAILFESGTYRAADGIITVYAPKSRRLQRVIERDGVEESAVLQRMDKQWVEQKKIHRSDFVIFSDGHHLVLPQILAAIRYFSERFKDKQSLQTR